MDALERYARFRPVNSRSKVAVSRQLANPCRSRVVCHRDKLLRSLRHPSIASTRVPHQPSFETFLRIAQGVHLAPVYRRLTGDTLTPVSAFHKIDRGAAACLFESVVGGE